MNGWEYLVQVKPEDLINPKRIDIIIKYYYIKAREKGENLAFAKEMYTRHMEVLSTDSLDKSIEEFDLIIDEFKENGLNQTPSSVSIGKNNEILTGAHWGACALYFDKPIEVLKYPALSANYGFDFFRERFFQEPYLDFIIKEYLYLKKEGFVLFSWPRIGVDENMPYIENILNQDGSRVLYQKKLHLDKRGLWNLMINIYKDEHWVGYKGNDFKWMTYNRDRYYEKDGFIGVFVITCPSLKIVESKKAIIRTFFKINNASLHSMDTYEASMEILELVLNEDYETVLYENFLRMKDKHFALNKHIMRRSYHFYQRLAKMVKKGVYYNRH